MEYDPENSCLKKPTSTMVTLSGNEYDAQGQKAVTFESQPTVSYLFTTSTCPNCALAKEYLKNQKVMIVDANENVELVNRYNVMQATTLVVVEGDSFKNYPNASNIKKYVDSLKEADKEQVLK